MVFITCTKFDIYIFITTIVKSKLDTVDSRYLEFDGTMEKIRVNRSSTQEELRKLEV